MFSVSAIGGFALAAAVTLVCFFFDDTIARCFNIDTGNTRIFAATSDYLRGLSLRSIPLTLNALMRTTITINGDRKRVKYTTAIVTVTNGLLNAVAILVRGMGMFGVGLATSVSQWIGLMIYLLHFAKRKIMCRFCFRHMRFGPLRDVLVRGSSRASVRVCNTLHLLVMSWRENRGFPAGLEQLMMLPRGFEIDPQRTLEVTISSMDAATGVSEKVMDFCLDKGVDHRRAVFAALCVEEMATNIIKHGFESGKAQSLLIRILYVNDDLILRFRDSCRLFDLREQYEASDKRDVTKNIGIRLVMRMSKDVLYLNTLNVNTTIIKI